MQTTEVALTKRATAKLSLGVAYSAAKNHRWLVGNVVSPNDEYFGLDDTLQHTFRSNGNYVLPWDIQLGGTFLLLSGRPGQRTNVFRAADPDGGPALRQLTTVTLRVEPFGDRIGPGPTVPRFSRRQAVQFRRPLHPARQYVTNQ